MAASQDDVIAWLLDLRLGEVPQLIETLEAELGTTASTYGVAATDDILPEPPLVVQLSGHTEGRRRDLIRALRRALGRPLHDVVRLIEQPSAIATLPAPEAAALREVLEAAGGLVMLEVAPAHEDVS